MVRFGEKQVNRFLEREKQAQEDGFTSSLAVEESTTNDQDAAPAPVVEGEK